LEFKNGKVAEHCGVMADVPARLGWKNENGEYYLTTCIFLKKGHRIK
jgi:hypothetical protein